MKTAIITGASSGLGEEYVRQVITQIPDIEEIWLVARRLDKLEALAARFSKYRFRCLSLDLTAVDSFDRLCAELEKVKPNVVLLVNNAGFGKLGNVAESTWPEQTGMIDLNCRALTAVTTATLPYMQKGGGILNVCSIASYVPTPRMAVYGATKAFVNSFSKALREEVRPLGIHVLAVCPGPMATDFLEVADIVGRSRTFEVLPYCMPEKVARISLKRLLRGKSWYTNRFLYKLYRVMGKTLPHSIMMKFSKT